MSTKRPKTFNDNPLWRPDAPGTPPQSPVSLQSSQLPEIIKKDGRTSAGAKRPARSFSDLLTRLYQQFDDLADEIAISNESPIKRAEALKSLAKTLPLLKAAEDSANVRLKDKPISDLSDSELNQLVAQALDNPRFPFLPESAAGSTPTLVKNKKSDSPVPHSPTSESDDE